MIMVRESGDAAPDVIEYRHGLTPPMRDGRKRRFRREPDLNVFPSLFTHPSHVRVRAHTHTQAGHHVVIHEYVCTHTHTGRASYYNS